MRPHDRPPQPDGERGRADHLLGPGRRPVCVPGDRKGFGHPGPLGATQSRWEIPHRSMHPASVLGCVLMGNGGGRSVPRILTTLHATLGWHGQRSWDGCLGSWSYRPPPRSPRAAPLARVSPVQARARLARSPAGSSTETLGHNGVLRARVGQSTTSPRHRGVPVGSEIEAHGVTETSERSLVLGAATRVRLVPGEGAGRGEIPYVT